MRMMFPYYRLTDFITRNSFRSIWAESEQKSWTEQRRMSHIHLPSKSTLAASTIPAMVYLGYIFMTKNGDKRDSNNNSNQVTSFSSSSCSPSNFNTELQEKLFKVQRSRLDPIEEEPQRERDYWKWEFLYKIYYKCIWSSVMWWFSF